MNLIIRTFFRSPQSLAIAFILLFGVVAGAWILTLEPRISVAADSHSGHTDHDDHEDHESHDHDEHDHKQKTESKESEQDDHTHDDHAHDDHAHENESASSHSDHEDGRHVSLSAAQIESAAISIEEASSKMLQQRLTLKGVIRPNQERLVHIVPRFPGIVRSIDKSVGSIVEKDDVLARIESNESLNQYEIKSPISGTVLEREAALGEFAGEGERIMIIADLSNVWIDFRVYQRDFDRLETGQTVNVLSSTGNAIGNGRIAYISPFGSSDTQSLLVRVEAKNAEGLLRPGLFANGEVELAPHLARIAVKETALQYLEGKPIIFVREGEEFVARDVSLGRQDREYVEILSGLTAGDTYASTNSFLLKAELGKDSAEHVH